jgi:hypothetical protein
MQMDQLVDSAIDTIADHLTQVGTQQAGQIANDAVADLYRLITRRLSQTPTGARVLGTLQHEPATPAARQQARDVLRDEAHADADFAQALSEAVRWTGTGIPARSGTIYGSVSNRGTGHIAAQAGRDVTIAGRDVRISSTSTPRSA